MVYYTPPASKATNYYDATQDQRQHHLKMSRFRKTWYLSTGKNTEHQNIGKVTIKAPFSQNPDLRLWKGRIPTAELKDLVLATNTAINAQGYLDAKSLDIASKLSIGHMTTLSIEDEEEHKEQMRKMHALFTYAQCDLCKCASCAKCFANTKRTNT